MWTQLYLGEGLGELSQSVPWVTFNLLLPKYLVNCLLYDSECGKASTAGMLKYFQKEKLAFTKYSSASK
jgi:hypothetical protein